MLGRQRELNEPDMKKTQLTKRKRSRVDEDTMRPEYDFSGATRGVTAGRYAQGTNVVILDPDVAALYPDAASVNEALRALAKIAESTAKRRAKKRSA